MMEIFKTNCCESSLTNTIRVSNNLDQDQASFCWVWSGSKLFTMISRRPNLTLTGKGLRWGYLIFDRYSQIFVVDSEPRYELLVSC